MRLLYPTIPGHDTRLRRFYLAPANHDPAYSLLRCPADVAQCHLLASGQK
jgi:hypothetical protein